MYKTKGKWFEGIIVACCKKARCDEGLCSYRFPYVVEKRPYTEEDVPVLIRFDADEYIKPRMPDRSPDPSKFKPELTVPDDPMHFLYSGMAPFNSKTEEGTNVADLLEKMKITDGRATTNPDGSIYFKQKRTGQQMSVITVENQGSVCGVDYLDVMMYVSNHINHRFPVDHNKGVKCYDFAGILKSVAPRETSLRELEWKAKNSPWKMLQLADALMLGVSFITERKVHSIFTCVYNIDLCCTPI
jgi:sulfur carrier protein ThiS